MTADTETRLDELVERLRARSVDLPPKRRRRAIREAAGATYRDVAETLGVAPMTVWDWERGATPRPENAHAYKALLDRLTEMSS